MMKEITVESIEKKFDGVFRDIDMLTDEIYERNTVSLKQIREAYEESRN